MQYLVAILVTLAGSAFGEDIAPFRRFVSAFTDLVKSLGVHRFALNVDSTR